MRNTIYPSQSLFSFWKAGKRDPKPYLREIVQVLKEDLKRTYGNGKAAQEIVDWYTLLGRQRRLKEDDMQRWFPGFPAPIIASNIPHLKLPPWYQRRPRFRDKLVGRLLNIDPQTGAFRQNIVALVGLPGSGKSSMILEVLSYLAPGQSVSMEILEQLQNHESMARAGVDVESALHELRENLLLTRLDQHNLRLHRLVSLHAAERLPKRAKERCHFDILGSLDELVETM